MISAMWALHPLRLHTDAIMRTRLRDGLWPLWQQIGVVGVVLAMRALHLLRWHTNVIVWTQLRNDIWPLQRHNGVVGVVSADQCPSTLLVRLLSVFWSGFALEMRWYWSLWCGLAKPDHMMSFSYVDIADDPHGVMAWSQWRRYLGARRGDHHGSRNAEQAPYL
jgi:hypothetical protein